MGRNQETRVIIFRIRKWLKEIKGAVSLFTYNRQVNLYSANIIWNEETIELNLCLENIDELNITT